MMQHGDLLLAAVKECLHVWTSLLLLLRAAVRHPVATVKLDKRS